MHGQIRTQIAYSRVGFRAFHLAQQEEEGMGGRTCRMLVPGARREPGRGRRRSPRRRRHGSEAESEREGESVWSEERKKGRSRRRPDGS